MDKFILAPLNEKFVLFGLLLRILGNLLM